MSVKDTVFVTVRAGRCVARLLLNLVSLTLRGWSKGEAAALRGRRPSRQCAAARTPPTPMACIERAASGHGGTGKCMRREYADRGHNSKTARSNMK